MKKKNIWIDLALFVLLTILFTLLIFLLNIYFSSWAKNNAEEDYIDRTLSFDSSKEVIVKWKEFEKSISTTYTWTNLKKNYKFYYLPPDFKNKSIVQTYNIEKIVSSNIFKEEIKNLKIEFYEEKGEVRGKMKSWIIKLFWVLNISNPELASVFVHELAHFIDIYFLENKNSFDKSSLFYDISWEQAKIIKAWNKSSDFVSGYAMTNKYEDFAESFNYYVLHNEDFLEKSKKSKILKEKYNFFYNIFSNNEFKNINFWNEFEIKDYYRDITKIQINLAKFLQYLENWI